MTASKKKSTEVATPKGGELATFDYGSMANAGFENMTAEDQAIPFVRILQPLSPEVASKDAKIEGAKPGMFFNTVTRDLTDELIFVPVATRQVYVEWRKRTAGGGLVGTHEIRSDVVAKARASAEKWNKLETPEGNDLVQTFYVAGLLLESEDAVDGTPAMLAVTSTGITPYKRGIGELRKFSKDMPLFAHRLRLTSDQQTNDAGTWFNWVIEPMSREGDGWRQRTRNSLIDPTGPQGPILAAAHQFCQDYLAGNVKTDEGNSRGETASPSEEENF